jgi:hypothetical protein
MCCIVVFAEYDRPDGWNVFLQLTQRVAPEILQPLKLLSRVPDGPIECCGTPGPTGLG